MHTCVCSVTWMHETVGEEPGVGGVALEEHLTP